MHRVVALISISLAVVLLALGGPRLVASVLKAPAFATLLAVHRGDPVAPEYLATAVRYLERSTRWDASGRLRGDLGFLYLLDATQWEPGDERRLALAREAAERSRDALIRAPVQPHTWVRLTYATMMEAEASPEVAKLLGHALEVGAHAPELALARVELLLQNWESLPDEVRLSAGRLIRLAWARSKTDLIEVAMRTRRTRLVRFALRSMPAALAEFDDLLARRAS